MLTSGDLSMMRDMVEDTLWDTCILLTKTRAADGYGGGSVTWAVGGTVNCRVDPVTNTTDADVLTAGRETLKTMYQLTVPYNTSISEANRVRHNSIDYEVLQLFPDHTYRACIRARIGRFE